MARTKQQAFNHVLKSIMAQGGPSFRASSRSSCQYVSRRGKRKCAAGHLVPPRFKDLIRTHEGKTAKSLIENPEVGLRVFGGRLVGCTEKQTETFISYLQKVHDDSSSDTFNDENFLLFYKDRMKNFATREGLSFPTNIDA